MSGSLYIQPNYATSRLRLHSRKNVVMSYTKNGFNFVENLFRNTSYVAGQKLYFGCTLLNTSSKYYAHFHFILSQLHTLY